MNYQTLERTIGHQFADIGLLDLAMTHPSYALQHKCQDNQRLEFLGDAVLEICVSRVIYHQYPKLREGQLTRKRAALVCEANLAKAATRLGLGSYLKLDRGEEVVGGRENPSILADTMEAVIAAVYLDAGMEEAAKLVDGRLQNQRKERPRREERFAGIFAGAGRGNTDLRNHRAGRPAACPCVHREGFACGWQRTGHGHGRAQTARRRGRRADGAANAA